ncbi:DUF4395 domain-containing protein [Pedobacter chinensis]|uniref:DUF4395 domain-containing protein n=1 Tax=Pedobacter chinensis TaxID=2282421 RepID=A0A369PTD7_9SPHI|nr:DUF4395 domain-containing protein [Pedobacter chinensis]RDC55510.1 DUF4395 domain-containing protein [Pedobacter chinensis]
MELSCPISVERVNENVIRIIAFIVALIVITCIVFSNYWAIVFLILDFALRAFTNGRFSILKFVAINVAKQLSLKSKMTDLAPKKFAAMLGFIFCLIITATFLLNFYNLTIIFSAVMALFALLESLFAICVGCYVYTAMQMITKSSKA